MQGGNAWIESLPERLVAQQQLLRLLLERTETEPDARWLVVGCSLARGNADELSDIDAGMGVTDGEVEPVTQRVLRCLAKYLRRGSPWEAHSRLERARELTWRMLAADRGVPEPQFGITSLLDAGADETGLEPTVAGLGAHELLHAARELAVELKDLQEQFAARGYEVPVALADFVSDYLERFQLSPTA